MSVGASSLSAVGIRNSDLGLLELTWKPAPMWKRRFTVPGVPRVIAAIGTGDKVSEGIFLPGMSLWARPGTGLSAAKAKRPLARFRNARIRQIVGRARALPNSTRPW